MLVRERLGLSRALVVNTDDTAALGDLADVAATLLAEVLSPGDVLGLGWSRAVLATAQRLTGSPPARSSR